MNGQKQQGEQSNVFVWFPRQPDQLPGSKAPYIKETGQIYNITNSPFFQGEHRNCLFFYRNSHNEGLKERLFLIALLTGPDKTAGKKPAAGEPGKNMRSMTLFSTEKNMPAMQRSSALPA